MHAALARRFTVLDHHHASLMAGTFPNRQYLHSAQSNGRKVDPGPLDVGIFTGTTIWDLLAKAHVPRRYYYTDIPVLLLWGDQYEDIVASTDRYFDDCEHGKLPRVSVLDPGVHRARCARTTTRWATSASGSASCARSSARSSGRRTGSTASFILVYDEWGGFFDHVPPPLLADDRVEPGARRQLRPVRVPGARRCVASPYAPRGGVDHRIVRPHVDPAVPRVAVPRRTRGGAERRGGAAGGSRSATGTRNNLGASLRSSDPEPEWEFDSRSAGTPALRRARSIEARTSRSRRRRPRTRSCSRQPFADKIPNRYPAPTLTPWITGEELTLPNAPTDDDRRRRHLPATTAPSTTPS